MAGAWREQIFVAFRGIPWWQKNKTSVQTTALALWSRAGTCEVDLQSLCGATDGNVNGEYSQLFNREQRSRDSNGALPGNWDQPSETGSIGIVKLRDCKVSLVESGSTLKVCGEMNELPTQRTVLALCARMKSMEN